MRSFTLDAAILLLATGASSTAAPPKRSSDGVVQVDIPASAAGASIPHSASFQSFSFEPAFWVEFFGNASEPNGLTFELLSRLTDRGGQPIIRPGGITQDSMIFNASAGDPVRTTNAAGGVYRTTFGPEYCTYIGLVLSTPEYVEFRDQLLTRPRPELEQLSRGHEICVDSQLWEQ